MKNFLLAVLLVSFIGCATPKYQTHMDLQPGMTKKQVIAVLGPPAEWEVYKKTNETMVEYLIYKNFESYAKKTPICFIDNKLAGWGQSFYQDHLDPTDTRLK